MWTNRDMAEKLLGHYFELIATNSGVNWNDVNKAEIKELVNCLIEAAKDELRVEKQ